jgi:hypothetical protein
MRVETEVSLMMEPIWQWGASVDRQALVWWLLVVVAVIVLLKSLAHWILKIIAKSLQALSVRPPDNTHDKPTLAAVALLHLKRTAAISAVGGHLIERVNGRFGPLVTNAAPSTFRSQFSKSCLR